MHNSVLVYHLIKCVCREFLTHKVSHPVQCNECDAVHYIQNQSKVLWMSKKRLSKYFLAEQCGQGGYIRNGSNEWRMRDRFGAIALLGLNLWRKSVKFKPTKHKRSVYSVWSKSFCHKKEEKDTSKCQKKTWFLH